jgi:hypothetical protein
LNNISVVSDFGFACWRVTFSLYAQRKTNEKGRSGTLRVPCDARQMAALRNSSLRSSNSSRLTRHLAALLGAFEGEFSTARGSQNSAFKIQCF